MFLHVFKLQMGMAHPIFLDLKFGQILFFSGGGVENWSYF